MYIPKRQSLVERFWPKVDKCGADECWPWNGATTSRFGYGYLGRIPAGPGGPFVPQLLAHRVSYELNCGPIPDGMLIRHTCDNPPCVNPAHLLVGTIADNMHDRDERGRGYNRRGHRNGRAKLNPDQVAEIRERHSAGETQASLVRAFGVSQPTISRVILRQSYDE